MIKILLIEDDADSAYITQGGLELIDGYEVHWAKDGHEGWELFQAETPDVVVTDVDMPRMNGYEVVRKIREINPSVIIIMESGKTNPKDVVKGYEQGVDDYIKKPFVAEELHARIQAILKRVRRSISQPTPAPDTNRFYIGNYQFDVEENTLQLHSEKLKLTKREAAILKLLHQRKNTVVAREEILTTLWSDSDFYTSRSLDVFISKLRKYLSKDTSIKIENVRGEGLRLVVR